MYQIYMGTKVAEKIIFPNKKQYFFDIQPP